jgi:hypothetical protein
LQNKKSGERVYWEWVGGEPILSKEDIENLMDRYSEEGEYEIRKLSSNAVEIFTFSVLDVLEDFGSFPPFNKTLLPPEFDSSIIIGSNGEITLYRGKYKGREKETFHYENYEDLVKKLGELLEKYLLSRSKMKEILGKKWKEYLDKVEAYSKEVWMEIVGELSDRIY